MLEDRVCNFSTLCPTYLKETDYGYVCTASCELIRLQMNYRVCMNQYTCHDGYQAYSIDATKFNCTAGYLCTPAYIDHATKQYSCSESAFNVLVADLTNYHTNYAAPCTNYFTIKAKHVQCFVDNAVYNLSASCQSSIQADLVPRCNINCSKYILFKDGYQCLFKSTTAARSCKTLYPIKNAVMCVEEDFLNETVAGTTKIKV